MDGVERSRVYWQCRRGMRELDVLLQGYFVDHYDALPAAQQQNFQALLACPDPLLLEYMLGRMIPSDPDLADVVERIRDAAKNQPL